MRTRLTLLCLFINFILVGCAGMPIMGKQSIPVPKSQSLADQEFKRQNKESAIHSQESTIKLASVDISVEKAMAQRLAADKAALSALIYSFSFALTLAAPSAAIERCPDINACRSSSSSE